MRYVAILGIVCLGTAGMLSGCSDGTEGSGGAGGGGTESSSSSSSSSSSGGGSGGGMASSSSSSSGGSVKVNNCDSATAEDHLADAMVKVEVGANGANVYSPACIRIKKGTSVTFEGNFTFHPTEGGVASLPPMPDSSSPIKQTTSGTSLTVKFDVAGSYPYYCTYHAPSMAGAVFVEE